jgi:hypothetical protein
MDTTTAAVPQPTATGLFPGVANGAVADASSGAIIVTQLVTVTKTEKVTDTVTVATMTVTAS